MHEICQATNQCWGYPGRNDIPPTTGCGERCGGHHNRVVNVARWYFQMVDDYHDNNPKMKAARKFLEENRQIQGVVIFGSKGMIVGNA